MKSCYALTSIGFADASHGTGPLPRPTTHMHTLLGGRAGEWAGTAPGRKDGQ